MKAQGKPKPQFSKQIFKLIYADTCTTEQAIMQTNFMHL